MRKPSNKFQKGIYTAFSVLFIQLSWGLEFLKIHSLKNKKCKYIKCQTFYGTQLTLTATDQAPTKTKLYNLMVREHGCWAP